MPVNTTRKYFHAQAIGFGGIIGKVGFKPEERLIDIFGASALSGAGGRHKNEATRRDIPEDLRRWIDFDSICVRTEGRFTEPNAVYRISESEDKNYDEGQLQTTTMSEVVIENLTVLGTFRAAKVSARMVSQWAGPGGDNPVFIDVPTFEGVTVNGARVDIEVNHTILGANTIDKLKDAFKEFPNQFFHPKHESKIGALIGDIFKDGPHFNQNHEVKYTFVSSVSGGGDTDKDQPNRLVVKDFGHIHFGEVLAKANSRRVAMLRFALGSADGGNFEGGTMETNGSWTP